MKKLLTITALFLLTLTGWADGSRAVVYKVDIKDEIGPEVWRMVRKSFDRAGEADYILIDMNTYGGMVVYADSLRSLILNSRVPVWVFINNNAASAGALISVACDKIYMREGANIGAATVVNQSGEAMPDKYQSYMRSMIRATAQAHGSDTVVEGGRRVVRWRRDPHIAEAMVDETIAIQGVTDSGKVVTFTPHEAMRHGFCDGIAETVEEVCRQEGLTDYEVVSYRPTWIDKVIGFFINPVVRGLLIMLIIGGIYFELQTPGVGFPLLAAVIGCILYFAPLYLEGIADYGDIILFVVGGILLLLEIFVLPGFGVAGFGGIVCVVSGLVLAGIDTVSFEFFGDFVGRLLNSFAMVLLFSTVAILACIWGSSRLFKSRRLPLALHAEQRVEEGYVGVDMTAHREIDKEGVAATDLRPSGKILVNGVTYDAVAADGEYISKGSPVRTVDYKAGQLYVKRINS